MRRSFWVGVLGVAWGAGLAALGCDASAGGGSTGQPGSSAAAISCAATTTCASARSIGSIAGDSPDGSVTTTTGEGSDWVRVRVREDVSDWTGKALHVTATLTPPLGEQLELHARANLEERPADGGAWPEGGPAIDCAAPAGEGGVTTLRLTWGEPDDGGSANGLDDGRDLAFEVRHRSGSCGGRWKLEVRGD